MRDWLRLRGRSFAHALRGIATLLVEEPNARLHALATALVIAAGLWVDLERADWRSLLLIIALVWLAEGMNTALENLADAAVPGFHPLVGKAKDVAAGTVLMVAACALVMALLVFLPYLVY